GLPTDSEAVAARIVHACGMPEVARELRISEDFCEAARTAIRKGRPIFVDAEMVRHGIIGKTLNVVCTLNDTSASAAGTTRSAAAVELWRPHLEGAFVVIGNAPTALFALLAMIDGGAPRPAAIAGFPVGFVGAAESKDELHRNPRGIPYATLLGRKGGSAMAAAVVNALTQDEA
ncbi:MAG: precorrin-8X methylmutase, partial [Rhizobiales bacterium]|nr:precorrin-8X methylmutase [Hyphomicrobiales bacterium]